uniref:Uncharacterized protein n=1 Tax=Rhizophora mucronata TaxID=61149 RepID=A0A2P2MFV9_RHIMU
MMEAENIGASDAYNLIDICLVDHSIAKTFLALHFFNALPKYSQFVIIT